MFRTKLTPIPDLTYLQIQRFLSAPGTEPAIEGLTSKVYFYTLDDFAYPSNDDREVKEEKREANEEQPLGLYQFAPPTKMEVAISVLKDKGGRDNFQNAQEFIDVQQLLANKKVNSPFIHTPYYYDSRGMKISPKTPRDLFQLLEANRLSKDTIKEISAQILLSVKALHEKNLVHRDIKLENYLFLGSEEDPHVRLWDLGWIITVDDLGRPRSKAVALRGTNRTMSPELKTQHQNDDFKKYQLSNLKAMDCFAVGHSLHELLNHGFDRLAEADFKDYKALFEGLKKKDPSERLTIEQAMESPWFGKTAEERRDYFAKTKNKKLPGVYNLKADKLNDFSLIKSHNIGKVNALIQLINNQIDSLNAASGTANFLPLSQVLIQYFLALNALLTNLLEDQVFLNNAENLDRTLKHLRLCCKPVISLFELNNDKLLEKINTAITNFLAEYKDKPASLLLDAQTLATCKMKAHKLSQELAEKNNLLGALGLIDGFLKDNDNPVLIKHTLKAALDQISTLPLIHWIEILGLVQTQPQPSLAK